MEEPLESGSELQPNRIIEGDCLEKLRELPAECIDFIFTSPPYADNRKKPYEGVPIKKYVEWFLPTSAELKRVLKPDGSFVLNIKERAVNGERQTYVLELILKMRDQGWLWVEEYIWHKANSFPGKWPNRFRDGWERCLHFTKQKNFIMYQDAVMRPMGTWREPRLLHLGANDVIRHESRADSGLGRRVANWVGRDWAYPTNVIYLPTESSNKNHSAAFPVSLPTWFIKLFTIENEIVLDPFVGSGTTAVAAAALERRYLGIEINPEYVVYANQSLQTVKPKLLNME